jgi:hypothetical protein
MLWSTLAIARAVPTAVPRGVQPSPAPLAKMFAVANPVVLSRPQARRAPVAQRGAALSVRAQGKVCAVPPTLVCPGAPAPSAGALARPRTRRSAAPVA